MMSPGTNQTTLCKCTIPNTRIIQRRSKLLNHTACQTLTHLSSRSIIPNSTATANALPRRLPLHALHLRQDTLLDLLTLSPLLCTILHADCCADHDRNLAERSFLRGLGTFGECNAGAAEEGKICFVAVYTQLDSSQQTLMKK